MPAELVIVQGSPLGLTLRLEKEDISIGRTGCDLALNDLLISRVHARIISRGAEFEIKDMGSRNGLFVNDIKVTRTQLADGDRINLGNTILQFHRTAPIHEDHPESMDSPQLSSAHTITLDAGARHILTQETNDQDLKSLRRAKSDLEAIYRADQIINTVLDPETLISRVMDIILAEIPKADICSLHLLQEDTGILKYQQQRRRDATDKTESPAFSTSLIRLVVQDRKAVLTNNAQQDGRLNTQGSIAFLQIQSAMCVPLQSRDHLLGVLQTNAVRPDRRFDRDDLKLLTAIGIQAGTALENALLYEKLTAEKAALHQAHENLKTAHERLVQSEKLAAVGRLTAGIVHDVKNPMTVILTYAELLERQLKEHGIEQLGELNALESLKTIQEGVLHCNEVISHLLQFARQAPPAKDRLQINDLVASVAGLLTHEISKAKARFEQRLAESLPEVMADAHQIRQVLLNILINALQALPAAGGHIRVVTEPEQVNGRIYAVCRIRDDGLGMTAEVKQRLFEPFFTTKKKESELGGTGLGLSVSYGIIQNHGGTIDVISEPGKGSTFSILLPVETSDSA